MSEAYKGAIKLHQHPPPRRCPIICKHGTWSIEILLYTCMQYSQRTHKRRRILRGDIKMALKAKEAPVNNGEIVFKKRGANNKKKVLIYGQDGSGKSTFAERYCNEHGLNPVVLDLEDSNYTSLPMLSEFDLSTDVKAYRFMKQVLDEITETDYDTIIIDGVDSLIESFISNANGMKCYADRSKTFIRFTKDCLKTGKHLIFVGQSPVDLDYYKGSDSKPNSCIIKLNAMVNEKYRIGDKYQVETVKYRSIDS